MPILASPTPHPLPPSHGAAVLDWMESSLVHGEGDREGEPFRAAPHIARATYRWYEFDVASELYRHHKGLIGWPKGSAKTEFEEAIALEHLEGPSWTLGTPVVTVGAVDGDQADELVRRAGMMIPDDSALAERLEVVAGRILQRGGGRGRILSTSAALGKNDGKLTSLLLLDEIHEWDGRGTSDGARRHGILERNANKRHNGRQLNVTTAGWSLESLAGAMYSYGAKVAAGEIDDPGFLMEWWEASAHWDLDDPVQLVAAIIESNPMAVVVPTIVARLVRSYHEHRQRGAVDEFIRYHLNRFTEQAEGAWLRELTTWDDRARPDAGVPADATAIVIGFDGSESGDSTAITGSTVGAEPHTFVIAVWEHPEGDPDWRVPVGEVEDALIVACIRWKVVEVAADVAYWRASLERLAAKGLPVVEFPQGSGRFAPACERLYEAVTRAQMTHDGDPRLRRHVANCRRRETEWGTRIEKEHTRSKRWIDLAVAAVMSNARAQQLAHGTATAPAGVIDLADYLDEED